MHVITVDN